MRRDRELVQVFLVGYNKLTGSDFQVREYPEDVPAHERSNGRKKAIEVIAENSFDGRLLAIEHTLAQSFWGERDDTQAFSRVFLPLETNPSCRVLGYRIWVWSKVGAIPRGFDWGKAAGIVEDWFARNVEHFPEGESIQTIPGLPFDLSISVEKERNPESRVLVGRSGMPDTYQPVIERALVSKLPKLAAAGADVRVLLLEKNNFPRGYAETAKLIDAATGAISEIQSIDEIWIVNTCDWEKSGSLWFLQVWPEGVSARFTIRETLGVPEEASFVRGWKNDKSVQSSSIR
jgi:hypothetical protein